MRLASFSACQSAAPTIFCPSLPPYIIMASTRARTRSRSNSVRSALQQVPLHDPSSPAPLHPLAQPQQTLSSSSASTKKLSKKDRWDLGDARGIPQSFGFWEDIWTGRWMVIPCAYRSLNPNALSSGPSSVPPSCWQACVVPRLALR